jgi:hypothetical protein
VRTLSDLNELKSYLKTHHVKMMNDKNNEFQQVFSRLDQMQSVISDNVTPLRGTLEAIQASQQELLNNQKALRNDIRQLTTVVRMIARHTTASSAGPEDMEEGASPDSSAQSDPAEPYQGDGKVFRDYSTQAGAADSSYAQSSGGEEEVSVEPYNKGEAAGPCHAKGEVNTKSNSKSGAAESSGAEEQVSVELSTDGEAAGPSHAKGEVHIESTSKFGAVDSSGAQEGVTPDSSAEAEAAGTSHARGEVNTEFSSKPGAAESSCAEGEVSLEPSTRAEAAGPSDVKEGVNSSKARAAALSGGGVEVSSGSSAITEAAGASQWAAADLSRYTPKAKLCLKGIHAGILGINSSK